MIKVNSDDQGEFRWSRWIPMIKWNSMIKMKLIQFKDIYKFYYHIVMIHPTVCSGRISYFDWMTLNFKATFDWTIIISKDAFDFIAIGMYHIGMYSIIKIRWTVHSLIHSKFCINIESSRKERPSFPWSVWRFSMNALTERSWW